MNNKIIGIIGGMGPEATANLYMKIIKATNVKKDQDHFRVIIDSNCKIPDRTDAILGYGESPVSAMVETGKNLELLGVDVGCIPCITAHYFLEDIQKELNFPVLNALEETYKFIMRNLPQCSNIGILATSGTIETKLFEKYMPKFKILYPESKTQKDKVMKAIYGDSSTIGIKGGNLDGEPLQFLKEASEELINKGAEVLISGCTEIGLVFEQKHVKVPLIDPMDVLAQIIVK